MKHTAIPPQPTESTPPPPPPPSPTPPPPQQKEADHQPSLFHEEAKSHAEESAIAPLKDEIPTAPSPNLFDLYRQQQKPKRNLFDE
jgi:hypothetical protein